MTEKVFIRKIPLPINVRAFTLPDETGSYNIYINDALSYEQQKKSLKHEIAHILNGDFLKEDSVLEIEEALNKLLKEAFFSDTDTAASSSAL